MSTEWFVGPKRGDDKSWGAGTPYPFQTDRMTQVDEEMWRVIWEGLGMIYGRFLLAALIVETVWLVRS